MSGMGLKGPRNGNWKGGRVVEPRGYVLIRVGTGHPLADCRGYAYEHRLVADAQRQLEPGEEVHHDDLERGNNQPSNLEPLTRAEHRFRHRKRGSNLRLPGEPNTDVDCECGCGARFLKFDSSGRPRRFVSGHNATRNELGQWDG